MSLSQKKTRSNNNLIVSVSDNSAASKARITPGMTLLSVNGNEIKDVLDYKFHTYEERLLLRLLRQDGTEVEIKLRHRVGEDIGLIFENYLMDDHRRCGNKCIFCFIDQNPKGCRESLYEKDDDHRLSFLLGNYISLTNLSDTDIERITVMRISPLHISVHTTDGEMRKKMLGNPRAGNCLDVLKKFCAAGITVHAQIVLCPGFNDGEELVKTLDDLSSLGENIDSVAVVPVGLTAHREGLTPIPPVTASAAKQVLITASRYKRVFCSDEFYLIANETIPPDEFYEEYPQLENGVGMLALFKEQWETADKPSDVNKQTLVTGTAAYGFFKELLRGYPVNVAGVKNTFFGETVTVAGLITGGDIIKALAGKDLGARVLIPKSMLRFGEETFLDGETISTVSARLGVPVLPVETDGGELAAVLSEDLT